MMLKKVLFLCLSAYAFGLSGIDSVTISASLYYQLSQNEDLKDIGCDLYECLISELEKENAPHDVITTAMHQYGEYQSGKDVQLQAKKLWSTLAKSPFKKLTSPNSSFKKNPLVASREYQTVRPWLMPENHPIRTKLDAIFSSSRATKDETSFLSSGFIIFKSQPRSFVRVARHPEFPGYVFKVYFDNELRIKRNKPGWYWLAKRCEGAKRIAYIIRKNKMKHFKVAQKWIYPLPLTPNPPKGSEYSAKAEILIAEDMDIVSNVSSREAWINKMTREHLDELFVIISYARGHSYRPDNIPLSRDGKFAFIDTEYPDDPPNFREPQKYFSPEMVDYWKQLIKQGGP